MQIAQIWTAWFITRRGPAAAQIESGDVRGWR
jgi:hypothetical protein